MAELGLSHKITFLLLDYRVAAEQFKGQFDRVVSIEMVEAVGVEFLPTYFNALRDLVKPSGSIMLQAISVVEAKCVVSPSLCRCDHRTPQSAYFCDVETLFAQRC